MTPRLLARGHDPWRELLGEPHDLGATPGLLATVHTWPQTRRLHPPIHALVTGGGLSRPGQWVAVHHGF
jgi:Putative transposase